MTSPTMRIRELTRQEGTSAFETIIGSFSFDPPAYASLLDEFRRECAEIGSNRVVYLGTMEDQAIAIAQLLLNEADNDAALADGRSTAHVHGLWVRRDHQGRGLAKQMMRHMEKEAMARGFHTLTIGVDNHNSRALRLYKALGYTQFKTAPGRSPAERLILMRRVLQSSETETATSRQADGTWSDSS